MRIIIGGKGPQVPPKFVITRWTSFIWHMSWWDFDDCELYIPYNKEIANSIKFGDVIYPIDDENIGYQRYTLTDYKASPPPDKVNAMVMKDRIMFIYSVHRIMDPDKGPQLLIKGKDVLYFLKYRACGGTSRHGWTEEGNTTAHIRTMVHDNVSKDADAFEAVATDGIRRMSIGSPRTDLNVIFDHITDDLEPFAVDPNKTVYENIQPLAKEKDRALVAICHGEQRWMAADLPDEPQIAFAMEESYLCELLPGRDFRSSCILSASSGSIISSDYGWDYLDYPTIPYIYYNFKQTFSGYSGSDSKKNNSCGCIPAERPKNAFKANARGIYRHEKPETQITASISTTNSSNNLISPTSFYNKCRKKAASLSKDYDNGKSFTGECARNIGPRFGVDYCLGDIVKVVDEFGDKYDLRVCGAVFNWDAGGHDFYPEFEAYE